MHDIGERLGTGAHMTGLRRTKVHNFSEKISIPLEELGKRKSSAIIPLENVLKGIGLKKIIIKKRAIKKALNGNFLSEEDIQTRDREIRNGDTVGLYQKKKIIALGKYNKNRIRIDRVIF